jgi:quercetin 2,3-dioxygenase
MEKKIKKISNLQFKINAPGFNSVDMFHSEFDFEPFLVFTEFHMDRPIFGPHPHAGVSVITYMLPDSKGSFLNRDSNGDNSIIEPGGMHVTQAGIGAMHDEVPTVTGSDCHGFQIWINHSDENRLVAPKAFHSSAKDIPEYVTLDIKLRVVQGNYKNLKSPIELVTKTSLFHAILQPNASIEFEATEMAFIYIIEGTLIFDNKEIVSPSIINFEKNGSKVIVKAGDKPANFMFATGTPHNEPIVYGGPFVMTTQQQMHDTRLRYSKGEMGILI